MASTGRAHLAIVTSGLDNVDIVQPDPERACSRQFDPIQIGINRDGARSLTDDQRGYNRAECSERQ